MSSSPGLVVAFVQATHDERKQDAVRQVKAFRMVSTEIGPCNSCVFGRSPVLGVSVTNTTISFIDYFNCMYLMIQERFRISG